MGVTTSRTIFQRLVAVAAAALIVAAWPSSPRAAVTLGITFPTRLAAGPDFATDVLKDAWDFNNLEDVGLLPGETANWSNFSVSGGLAGGTTTTNDASLSLLHSGYYTINNPGKNGINFPIDSTKYQKIAFRMSSNVAGNDPQIYWFHTTWLDPVDTAGTRNYGVAVPGKTVVGFKTYVADLTRTPLAGSPWASTGIVRGLRLDPNNTPTGFQDGAGKTFFYDWVRLTYGDNVAGAAKQNIQWSGGTGPSTIDVYDGTNTAQILNVATSVSGTSFLWNYGVLPPGSYTLRISQGGVSGSQPFTINNPPTVTVTDPSRTTGQDYATTVLGNAWDMSDPTDIVVLGNENITGLSFTTPAGQLTAKNTSSDPSVTLLHNFNNDSGTKAIDTSKYRYLTYRMSVDGPFDMLNGSVARVHWGSEVFPTNFTTTKDILVWAGMNSYTLDLATFSDAPSGGLEPSTAHEPWTTNNKTQLRFDPDEFDTNGLADPMPFRFFHIDDIKLTANPVSLGSYTIHFAASDADILPSDPVTVTLYRDTDLNPTNGKTVIVSGLTAVAGGVYTWNTSAVPSGAYYIYAEVTDGLQTTGSYSDAPLVVSTPVTQLSLDAPLPGASVQTPFLVTGWALNAGAATGTGVDAVHVYAFPSAGGSQFLGFATYGIARGDVATLFGLVQPQFTNSGFSLTVSGLAPGSYQIAVYAHNAVTGAFDASQVRTITVSAPVSLPVGSIDLPGVGSTVPSTFQIAGWSLDRGASSGTGVDAVHVYAINTAGAATFLGVSAYGFPRADIGGIFGSAFTNSGYNLSVSLPPGAYTLRVYSRSTVSGTFSYAERAITVPSGNPLMTIDTPATGAAPTRPFLLAGWAVDLDSTSGPGVDAINVWAYPTNGTAPVFVNTGSLNFARGDVGRIFGARFTNCGYNVAITSANLPAGTYLLAVYAHSTVTGTFNQVRTVTITVQ